MADVTLSFACNTDVEEMNHIQNIADEGIFESGRMKAKKEITRWQYATRFWNIY
jgi:hypothetical protein